MIFFILQRPYIFFTISITMPKINLEDILSHIVEPLNQILNGEEPNHPLDSAYSRTQVERSKYNEDMSFVFDDYENSVVGYRELYYTPDTAAMFSKALTRLYIELLTNPGDRMYTDSKAYIEGDVLRLNRQKAVDNLRKWLREESHFEYLFEKIDVSTLISRMVEVEVYTGISSHPAASNFRHVFITAALRGYKFDWENLYTFAREEVRCPPQNYIKQKVEYCCVVLAVSMVMRSQPFKDKKTALLHQLLKDDTWVVLYYLYSIISGHVLDSEYLNLKQVIDNFVNTWRKHYAHLLLSCINFRDGKCSNPQVQKYLTERKSKVEAAVKQENQKNYLDELFNVIMPRAEEVSYDNDTFDLTSAERTLKLREAQQHNKALLEKLNALKFENTQLRAIHDMAKEATAEGVRIESIREMFQNINDYDKAKQMFMEIDYYLKKDPTWKNHYDELRTIIEKKDNSNRVSQNVTVNGDYIVNKQVANEVNGVGKNSVGINFIKE